MTRYTLDIDGPDCATRARVRIKIVREERRNREAQKPHNSILPCISCGRLFILPFTEGNEKGVLCEECNV